MSAHRVNFVDEDDAGRVLLTLLKQVATTRGANAHKHLDEVGTRNREERNVRFAGDSTRQQCLAGSRWSHHQDTLGNPTTKLLKLLRLLEKLDNLLQFLFRFFNAGHVFKGHALLLVVEQLGARLAKRKRFVAARLHLAQHEYPDGDNEEEWRPRNQHGPDVTTARLFLDLRNAWLSVVYFPR